MQVQSIHQEKIMSARAELDLKNATRQLIDLRIEAHENQVLPQKQPHAGSNMQSFDGACFETLVHPGMLSHPNPGVSRLQSTNKSSKIVV